MDWRYHPALCVNVSSVAVLLIRDAVDPTSAVVWALSYGMGFHYLDHRYVDPSFGLKVAVRAASAADISGLTGTTLDTRSRTQRTTIRAVTIFAGSAATT